MDAFAIDAVVALPDGRSFKVIGDDANRPIVERLRAASFPIEEFSKVLTRYSPGSVVFDIGANIGIFAFMSAALGHHVHCFEASSTNVDCLIAGVRENPGASVAINNVAVSDREETVHFVSAGPYGHISGGGKNGVVGIDVQAIRIDDYVRGHNIQDVALIKMDIEGAELMALRGMTRLLKDVHPDIIIESNGHTLHDFNETPNTLLAHLHQFGYRFFYEHGPKTYEARFGDPQVNCTVDYLCTTRPDFHFPDQIPVFRDDRDTITILSGELRNERPERHNHAQRVYKTFATFGWLPTDGVFCFGCKYEFATSAKESGEQFLGAGWSAAEYDRTWSEGNQSFLEFEAQSIDENASVALTFELMPFIHPNVPSQDLTIQLNGSEIFRTELTGRGVVTFSAPARIWNLEPRKTLVFSLPNAVRPFDLGGRDKRPLGVALISLTANITA